MDKPTKRPKFLSKVQDKYQTFIEKQRKNGNIDRVENGMHNVSKYMKEIEGLGVKVITRHPYWQGTRLGLHWGQKAAEKLFYSAETVEVEPKVSYTETFSRSTVSSPLLHHCILPAGHRSSLMIDDDTKEKLLSLPYVATLRDVHIYWLLKDKIAIGNCSNRSNVRNIPDNLSRSNYFIYLTNEGSKTSTEVNRYRREAGAILREIFGVRNMNYSSFSELENGKSEEFYQAAPVSEEDQGVDFNIHTYESELVDLYAKHKGIYKAVYVGPPGTGKSRLAQKIAGRRGSIYTTLAHQIGRTILDKDYPLSYTRIGNLRSVIIEDIDRSSWDDKAMLSLLRFLDKPPVGIEYIAITCNNIQKLPPAIYRAGRVDEIREILELPPSQAAEILQPYTIPEKFLEEVRNWPVAYLIDLKNKIDIFGVNSLPPLIETISKRVNVCNTEYRTLSQEPKVSTWIEVNK